VDRQHEKRDELEGRKWWVIPNANDAEGRFRRLVYDKPIGRKELSKLKPLDVERWLFSQIPDDDEVEELDQIRRAKDSANRNLVALKAALNRALESRLISSVSPGAQSRRSRKSAGAESAFWNRNSGASC
jgi:hypothetical protein